MALINAWPVSGDKKSDWERMIQVYGLCEVLPDRSRPAHVEKTFRDWAMKRRLAFVEGENMVAFDPKVYNPKDSLDRAKFGFLLRYIRPRDFTNFRKDVEKAFNLRSMYVLDAVRNYWLSENVIYDVQGKIMADREVLRLMGFSYLELMQALDGVVKREYLGDVVNGHALLDPVFGQEFGNYFVNFEILKERFFDAEFLLHAAGQPVTLVQLGREMGIDDMEDLKAILREAKKRYNLNIEISDDHAMFGAPSQKAIDALITKERNTKQSLEQSETHLRDRLKTVKELLDRYNAREAKLLNECESLHEEGRIMWIKAKVVNATLEQIGSSSSNGRHASS